MSEEKVMVQIEVCCPDYPGAAANVMRCVQMINVVSHNFRRQKRKLLPNIGHISILVRDKDANKAIVALQGDRELWGLRVLYWLNFRIRDESGVLVQEILDRISRENIDTEYGTSLGSESISPSGTRVVSQVLDCTEVEYALVKNFLKEYVVYEDSFVPDAFFKSFAAFKAY